MEKHKKLINRLLESTRADLCEWEEVGQHKAYQLSFAQSSVRIREEFGEIQDSNDYILDLVNGYGQVVESVSDNELDRDFLPERPFYAKCRELYELARRRALGADKVLDDILSELEQQLPF